jgi:CDP-2,3-bis-(O-geranylgeranyl)-sn-glycerol synthase
MSAPDPLRVALFLIAAFVVAGLAHSAWLRSPASRRFVWPVDAGLTVRGRRLFGANKTVRGLVVMIPAAGAAFAAGCVLLGDADGMAAAGLWRLDPLGCAFLGAWAGAGFMLGELPNSFVKRQLGIAPGAAAAGRVAAAAHFVVDRVDSIIGMLVALSLVVPVPMATWGWMLLLAPGVHWLFSVLLHRLGVKARPA